MEEQLDDLLFQYNLKFKEGFPTYQLFRGRTDQECIEMVQRCLDKGKTAYQLGLLSDSEDIQY